MYICILVSSRYEGGIWVLIVPVPVHCLRVAFVHNGGISLSPTIACYCFELNSYIRSFGVGFLCPIIIVYSVAHYSMKVSADIMLTCPCNVHPLTPHFYIVKMGFIGVLIIFLFLL